MHVCYSLSHVQLFAAPWTAARQAPLSMGILQARILEWVAIPSSKKSSWPRDEPRSPTLQADYLSSEPPGKPKNTGVCSLSLLQGIFLTQELNWVLLHCRWILYQLNYQESIYIYIYTHIHTHIHTHTHTHMYFPPSNLFLFIQVPLKQLYNECS